MQVMPPHRPFFTVETAAAIRRGLEPLLSAKGKPLATSVDMPVAEGLQEVLKTAKQLSEELRHEPATPAHIGPLHLLAATLSIESSDVATVLKQAGVSREAVIEAIRTGEY